MVRIRNYKNFPIKKSLPGIERSSMEGKSIIMKTLGEQKVHWKKSHNEKNGIQLHVDKLYVTKPHGKN